MPELPEVEAAMTILRERAKDRMIADVKLLHPALSRRVTPTQLRALRGARVSRVERRGKHQLLHLDDGRILHVHFRMNGDWAFGGADEELPRFARATVDFTDGTRLVLVDSRALGTLDVHPANVELDLGLGPDAADRGWTADQLGASLSKKRGPVKPVLLDQRVVAGLGNIYAAESLWRARISPLRRADSLDATQVRALRDAIEKVIERATGSRYTDDDTVNLDVYDREGLPCRRCGTKIERIVQAGRSTYFCPVCQPLHAVVGAGMDAKNGVKSRKPEKQSAQKPAGKSAKKIAKNAVKKVAKNSAKKPAKKSAQKPAKKPAKKS